MTPLHTGTTFFTPTGPVFSWLRPDVSAFTCTFVLGVTVFAWCYRAVLCVLRGRGLILVSCDRVSCVSDMLPLLASCDRVVSCTVLPCGPGRTVPCSVFAWCIAVADSAWSCGLVMRSGRTVWSSVLLLLGSYRIVCARSGLTVLSRLIPDIITV